MFDERSTTWAHIVRVAREELRSAQATLETPGLSMDETERLRGAIWAWREVISIPERLRIKPSQPD